MSRTMRISALALRTLVLVVAVAGRSHAAARGVQRPDTARRHAVMATRDDSPAARARRLQQLDHRRRALDSTGKRERTVATSHWFTDTVQAGLFRIATTRRLREGVRRAATALSRELRPSLDATIVDSLRRHLIHVRPLLPEEGRSFGPDRLVVWDEVPYGLYGPAGGEAFLPRDDLRLQLTAIVGAITNRTMDDAMRTWLFNVSVVTVAPPATVKTRARMDIATAGSFAARRCVVGDFAACARVLSLRGRPADPAHAWYAPEDYRDLASRLRLAPPDGDEAPRLQRRCLTGDAAACSTLIKRLGPDRLPAPTLEAPRLVLLHEALRLGGDGAITRLRASTGDIGTRLSAAAGVEEDSLLSSWRRRVISQRGARIRPTGEVALATIGWTLLLTGLGLRRTRRCD